MRIMSDVSFRPAEHSINGYRTYDISTGAFRLHICPDQLRKIRNPIEQRLLFKSFVKRVVIETSSFCNRRCRFCPNADGSRLGEQKMMAPEAFSAVLDDLAEIDFDGLILFHLYNEPLANASIFDEVAQARAKLPKCRLHFNTNGDYIRHGTLAKLARAGLSSLHVSIYGPDHGVFHPAYVEARVAEMAATCGLPRGSAKWLSALECRAAGVFVQDDLKLSVTIQARNFNEVGYDRGALVTIPERSDHFWRHTPCPSPFEELLLTWDGTAVPCCNVVGDNRKHAAYTVGKLNGRGSIFALYADGPLVDWRRSLLKFDAHKSPCSACTRMATKVDRLDSQHLAFNAVADQLLRDTTSDASDDI